MTIPASSIGSEQVNSRGSDCVPKKRCRLGPESIRASVCLKAWNRVDSLDTVFEEESDIFVKTTEISGLSKRWRLSHRLQNVFA